MAKSAKKNTPAASTTRKTRSQAAKGTTAAATDGQQTTASADSVGASNSLVDRSEQDGAGRIDLRNVALGKKSKSAPKGGDLFKSR